MYVRTDSTDSKRIYNELYMISWGDAKAAREWADKSDRILIECSSFKDDGGDFTNVKLFKDNNVIFRKTIGGY